MRHAAEPFPSRPRARSAAALAAALLAALVALPLAPLAPVGAAPLGAQAATGSVRGVVLSAAGEPIARASVIVEGTAPGARARGATADDAGGFLVAGLAAGPVTLRARALGFRPALREVVVRAGDTVAVTFRLDPTPQQLGAVRTEARSREREQFEQAPDVGTVSLSGSSLSRVPSVGEPDVLRTVQLLPGVVARNDFSAGYNVRGGESDQNLVLLDGIPIYNPFHLGGLFGTFLDETVGEISLLTGAFPSSYGGRLSSVLDVRSAAEGRSGVHGAVGVSLLSSSAKLGGAIEGGRTSWNVAARRTYADVVTSALTRFTLPYHFQDAQLYVLREMPRGGSLSVTAYAGSDVLDGDIAQLGDSTAVGGGTFLFRWGNALAGLTWRQPLAGALGLRLLGDSAALEQRASLTRFATTLDLGGGAFLFDNAIDEARLSGAVSWFRGGATRTLGYEWSQHRVRYDVVSGDAATRFFTLRQRPAAVSVYVDELRRPSERLMLRAGVRAERVTGTGWTGVSPRVSAKWFASRDLAVTLAGAQHAQWLHAVRNEDVPVRIFDFWVASDPWVRVATARHAVLGVERWLGDRRFVRVESYWKGYRDLPEPNDADDPTVRGDEFSVNDGSSYGLDLLVRQLEGGPFSGWLSYGYGVSARRRVCCTLGQGGAASFWPAQDRRHNLNAVGSARLPGRAVLTARFGYGTGTPFTTIVGQLVRRSYDGEQNIWDTGFGQVREPVGGARNGERYPAFHRLDVGVSRAFDWRGATVQPYLQVVNVYNRKNVFTYVFDYAGNPPTREAISQFPLLPSLGLTVEF